MLITGIISHDGKSRTANLINSIFATTGKKVSIVESKSLGELGRSQLKSYISELDRNSTDILILKINILDVEKEIFDYLHFDVMICADKTDDLRENNVNNYKALMRKILSLVNQKGIMIVNVDDTELIQFLQGAKYYTITYGFNSKASITASSIGDIVFKDNFLCCLQRCISTKNGMLIEPQEYSIKVESSSGFDAYNVLAAATFAIINGIDLNALDTKAYIQ